MNAAGEWADGIPDDPDDPAALAGGDRDRADRLKKSPSAFRTISEVADDLHIPQHVLRFWETRFPQVRPLKRGGGRRYYRPDDIVLLRRISELLYIQGYTIKGVQRLLREGDGTLRDVPPLPDAGVSVIAAEGAESFDEIPPEEDAFPEPEWAAVEPAPVLPKPVEEPAESEPVAPLFDAVADENRRLREMLHAVLDELQSLRRRIPF